MANTSSHPVTINGTRLDTWAYNLKVKDGLFNVPNRRGGNLEVPGRHGELWVPNRRFGPGTVTLSMWVRDRDVDDVAPTSNPYWAWRKNLDTLLQLFNSSYALLDVQHTLDATDIRQAFCDVKAISDPNLRNDRYGELVVSMDIPDTFWQTTADFTWQGTLGTGAISTQTITNLAGATAPNETLKFLVDGPVSNPRITDVKTGHYVQLNKTLADGESWMLDAATWSSKTGANTIAWTTNGVISTLQTVAVGAFSPALMGIAPGSTVQVQLSGTGAGVNTRLSVRGRRKFL